MWRTGRPDRRFTRPRVYMVGDTNDDDCDDYAYDEDDDDDNEQLLFQSGRTLGRAFEKPLTECTTLYCSQDIPILLQLRRNLYTNNGIMMTHCLNPAWHSSNIIPKSSIDIYQWH